MSRQMITVLLLVIITVLTILCGTLLTDVTKKELFRITSYYFVLLSFSAMLLFIVKDIRFSRGVLVNLLKENLSGICICVILVLVFTISIGGHFRVLADETNLIGVSKSMFLNKASENSYAGYWYYNGYHPIFSESDKRPNLFPFLVSLAHTIFGYSAYNGFVVNFILSFFCLFNLYLFAKTLSSKNVGIISILLTASYPVFVLSSTSSGFEMVNLLFIIITLRYFYDYSRYPQPAKLNKLLFTLALLSQCRYESFGIALLFVIAVLWIEVKKKFADVTPITAIVPLLSLPVFWQRSTATIKTYTETTLEAGQRMFSFDYVIPNLLEFLKLLFYPANNQSMAWIINYIALIGIVYLGTRFLSKSKPLQPHNRQLILLFCLVFLFYFVGLMTLWVTKYINIVHGRRFSLPIIPFFVLPAAYLIKRIMVRYKIFHLIGICILTVLMLFYPLNIVDEPGQGYILGREYILKMNFLKRYTGEDNIFIICERPGLFTVHNYGAADFDFANNHKIDLIEKINRHLINKVIVMQEINFATQMPTKSSEIDPVYTLRTVLEIQNDAVSFQRFSEYEPR